MPISPMIKYEADRELAAFCEVKIPIHVQGKIRLSLRWVGSKVTIIEHRPYLLDREKWTDSPVAQLRFDSVSNRWSLFCRDRNQRWHSYQPMPSSSKLHELISEIDHDQTCIFWG